MTGTPLQNNTEELWCLLHFLAPDAFADLEQFVYEFGNPPTAAQVPRLLPAAHTPPPRRTHASSPLPSTLNPQP